MAAPAGAGTPHLPNPPDEWCEQAVQKVRHHDWNDERGRRVECKDKSDHEDPDHSPLNDT
jgi:hypothetical protein